MFELAPKAVEEHTVYYYDLPAANCIAESGNVSLAYSPDGVTVSVSLDTDGNRWEKAMADEGMPWPQWSSLEGFKSESAKSYAAHAIPYVVLIDAEGRLVSVNKHGEILEKTIAGLLK